MRNLAKTATNALAAFGLASIAVSPALASESQTTKITVKTSDLDLGTAAGQKALDQRVAKAVRGVCRTTNPNTGTRLMSRDAMACLAKARTDAKQQVAALIANEQRGG